MKNLHRNENPKIPYHRIALAYPLRNQQNATSTAHQRPTRFASIPDQNSVGRTIRNCTNQPKCECAKTLDTGFCYQYPTIESAMEHLHNNPTI